MDPVLAGVVAFVLVVASGMIAMHLLLRGHLVDIDKENTWDDRVSEAVHALPDGGGPLDRLRARYGRWTARMRLHVLVRFFAHRFNAQCPECDEPVVAYGTTMVTAMSIMFSPRTEAELRACCARHGHAPYNTPTVRRCRLEAAVDANVGPKTKTPWK